MALAVDELNTATYEAKLDEVATDNAYDESPFFKLKLSKGGFTQQTGGEELNFGINYKKQGTAESAAPRKQITFENVETLTEAKTYWAFYNARAMMFWDEKVKNAGKSKVIDLAANRIEVLKKEILDKLCTDLLKSGSPAGDYDLTPIPYIVDSANTYGGIAVTDAANWASQEDAATTTLTLFGSGSLSYYINACSLGTNRPTLHLTTRNLYSKFMSKAEPMHLHTDEETAKLGFQNLVWIDAPVMGDNYVPSGYWLGLDMDAFDVLVNGGKNGIEYTPWIDLTPSGYINTAGKIATFVGQVICRRRRTSFKYSALDYTL